MPELSIIILNYNTQKVTESCIRSLITYYKDEFSSGDYELIVYDNGSTDSSAEGLEKFAKKEGGKFFATKTNRGFTGGSNDAAKHAKGVYLFFLNSDTASIDGSLSSMISFAKEKDAAVVGAKLLNPNGSPQPSCGRFYTVLEIARVFFGTRLSGSSFIPAGEDPVEVDWVSGGAFMIRRAVFEELGGFDEGFFMYIEDMDLCLRVKKLGGRVFYYPKTRLTHVGHGSSNRSYAIIQIYKGVLYFFRKHKTYPEYMVVKCLLATKAFLAIVTGLLTGNSYLITTYKKALAASL